MTTIIPLRVAQRLSNLYDRQMAAVYSYNEARASVLEMIGLDPANTNIGFNFLTGQVLIPSPTAPAPTELPKPTETPTEQPAEPATEPPAEQAT